MSKKIALLGATGSIGTSTLDVLKNLGFELVAFSFHSNINRAKEIVKEFHTQFAVCTSNEKSNIGIPVLYGRKGLEFVASLDSVDIVLVSTAGTIGVFPTLAALKSGKRVALANKETLVSFGPIVKKTLRESNGEIIPVDSEHSAIFQLLDGRWDEVKNIYLTASGGPFRKTQKDDLKKVRPQDALKHPTWNMGRKITIDSATMINKGLEIIEAYYLFDMPPERIKVIVHPQSIIHGMVELRDGAWLAHLSFPDMRIPIQYALTYPERLPSPVRTFNPFEMSELTFEKPDMERFPGLKLAYEVLKESGELPTIFNAANEEAVYMFLDGKIGFTDIPEIIRRVIDMNPGFDSESLDDLLQADRWAREKAKEVAGKLNE